MRMKTQCMDPGVFLAMSPYALCACLFFLSVQGRSPSERRLKCMSLVEREDLEACVLRQLQCWRTVRVLPLQLPARVRSART